MSQQQSEVVEGVLVDEDAKANTGLAILPDTGLRPIDLGQLTAWAESRQKALAILMEVAIASTKASDWSDQGGKPYPEQGACSAIIGLVGINITPPTEQKEYFDDELGRYYIYFLASEITVPKFGIGPLPIIGRASSRDQFFAWKRDSTNEKVLRPQSEIDPGDIKGKAYTNLRYRAVKAAVPEIAGMTFERLKELTGGRVASGKVKQIHYGGENGEEGIAEGNCPTCGKGNLQLKEGKSQKTGKPYKFWGCDRYPDCKHIQNDPPEAPQAADSAPADETTPADPATPPGDAGGTEHPRPAVATVLDILGEKGNRSQQMLALAKAAQKCGLTIAGADAGVWLSSLDDEMLGRIVTAMEAQA